MRYSMLALAAALFCGSALADDTGLRVTVGAVNVNPNAGSGHLGNVEAAAGLPAGSTELDVSSNTQLGLIFTYDMDPNWSVELLAATPFSHDITLKAGGTPVDGMKVGKTKQLPPTLSLQYRFMEGQDVRPYLGLGINHTIFFQEKVDGELASTLDSLGLTGDKELKLSSSTGLAAQAGFDWKINEKTYLKAAIWYADIDTDAKVKVDGQTVQKVKVNVDPVVAFIGVGYRF
ncbi:outer membrane beta-barrel protein [Gallaecimonas kandeliae]|uniref:OmpW/AlkL family protein n=1 Tax=Gallaecimonas kandeliae TaxID=3029055 RepID=UPI00264815A5|nr:OmpW family outer membrane protein [Gallaecimonas kandeliae]WKE67323.1 outer membrane beta-barrel protein [Gallaecimonas kandeliae]